MDRADVVEFIARINALVAYVPPILMDRVKDSPVAKALFAIGAGHATCTIVPIAKASNKAPALE
jgi:hypothetical protein